MGRSLPFISALGAFLAGAVLAWAGSLDRVILENLGDMDLVRAVRGEEALAEIDRLHGRPIEARDGFVALYRGPDSEEAEVWASGADSEIQAARQVQDMVARILADPKSPFRNHALINRVAPDSRSGPSRASLHRFTGAGKTQYVFSAGDMAYWVEVGPGFDPGLLDAFLFPGS